MSQITTYQTNLTTLSRRPEARGFRVEQLLQEAVDGRLRIPLFQRPLRWRSKQVIEYFDSIRRGFPVGNLLLSREKADAETLHFGPRAIHAPENNNALWVVDGQQRITALVACLLRLDKSPRRDFWAIWYDLQNESFVHLNKSDAPPGWIPLNVLNNSVSLLKWIRDWPYGLGNPELVDRALELGKAIREYEVPTYTVEGANEHLLRLIFTRVNTAGVTMRESEIFEARYGKEGNKPIRSAVARLRDLGFGELDADLFLRCLRMTLGISATKSTESPENYDNDSILRTENALRRSVGVIQSAGIPHWKLMPYRLPLIFLCRFFDKFPAEDNRVDRLAARWIWQGALTGDHDEVTDSKINRLLKQALSFGTADEAIASLLQPIDSLNSDLLQNNPCIEFDKPVSMGRASGKIFVVGLLAIAPEFCRDSVQLDLDFESDESESISLDEKPIEEVDLSKIVLSITKDQKVGTDIIVRRDDQKLATILDADPATLQSFVLDQECVQLIQSNQLELFRERRRQLLQVYFSKFVRDRIGDINDVRPSIKTISDASIANIPEETVL